MLLDDGIPVALVHLLVFWYSKWNSVLSGRFTIGNGTRQSGVLSPYLFSRYIRGLIQSIASSHVRCSIGDMMVSILAYADDIVLFSFMERTPAPHRQIDVVCRGYQYDM